MEILSEGFSLPNMYSFLNTYRKLKEILPEAFRLPNTYTLRIKNIKSSDRG